MAENMRRRKEHTQTRQAATDAGTKEEEHEEPPITIVDGLRVITGLLLINFLLSYFITGNSYTWGYSPWWVRPKLWMQKLRPPVILTDRELLAYDGRNASLPIYLGLNGTIYDVTAGRGMYGPGGSYNIFAGRDAARGFITGCFQEDSVPDVRGAEWTFIPRDVPRYTEQSDAEISLEMGAYRREMVEKALEQVEATIVGWAKMFRGETGKDYFEVGKIKRKQRWLEREPTRPLCESAERGRPQSQFGKHNKAGPVDAGAKYRGG